MSRNGRPSLRPQAFLCGALLVALGVILHRSGPEAPGGEYSFWPILVGVAVLVSVPVSWWQGRGSSAGMVNRWSRRGRRTDGVATRWEILRRSSRFAMRRRARVLRPGLFAALSWWQALRVPTREFATPLLRAGLLKVWSPVEDVTLRAGGPRMGKSGELGCRILDAPGAVIATSTRLDLLETTGLARSQRGPVWVFNPAGVGGEPSSIMFDPLSGCADPVVAAARAEDLVAGGGAARDGHGGGEREYWDGQARQVLAALLHAAALGGASMRQVSAWVADPEAAAPTVTQFLRRSPEPDFEQHALQFVTTNERTRSSVTASIRPALTWLTNPTAQAAALGGAPFDVAELLRTRGTVFMLGAEDARTAPLVTALTGHIAREARRLAAMERGGRLDPPLTLALDEAALICPIPLDNWTADMGGRGVTIHIACQSPAQLRQRWGTNGAGAILNNAGSVLVLGGMRNQEDLKAFSELTGERDEHVATFDEHGAIKGHTVRRVPVLSMAQLAQLREGQAVLFRRGMAPVIGRVEQSWRRPEVRRAARAQRRAQRIATRTTRTTRVLGPVGDATRALVAWVREQRTGRRLRHQAEAAMGPTPHRAPAPPAPPVPVPPPADVPTRDPVPVPAPRPPESAAPAGRVLGDPSRFTGNRRAHNGFPRDRDGER